MQFKRISLLIVMTVIVGGSLVVSAQQDMQNMPGMKMGNKGTQKKKTTTRKKPNARKHNMANMPGMNMPTASPNPQASPQSQMQMNMPGMQTPQATSSPGAQPGVSPQTQMNMPGMNMPMPGASPSASPMGQMPGMNMGGMNMNMGPLMVMSDTGMGVRVGSSEANVMDLGQMGSGTSWQPDTSPSYMMDKQTGDWLLMFHYNAIVGVNAQG